LAPRGTMVPDMPDLRFDLGTLGWKAFQDLSRTILAEQLGQTVQVFSATRDRGRDAAFVGTWKRQGQETIRGRFAVQCKFLSGGGPFAPSLLRTDLPKIHRLHQRGLADAYVLMTNGRVSGSTEERISEEVRKQGPRQVLVIGGELIDHYLAESKRLRALVPRLYGLGDLGEILDDRVYAQSRSVIAAMSESLAKFVVTEPYGRSIEALNSHGFVLLLGEPMAGKSMIAAALAVAAADQWGCGVIKADAPTVFVDHWNPHSPGQFFWVDDAFGTTQYVHQRADDWNRILPQLHAAVTRGTRVVMTSRDYIWKSARMDLKLHQFRPLEEAHVIVDVRALAAEDRRQILYNHLKYGEQPRAFLTSVKPFLEAACQVHPFLPEVARRFGDPRFTETVRSDQYSVVRFFQRPLEYLRDVLNNLAPDDQAALALIYMAHGKLASPVRMTPVLEEGIRLLGADSRRMRAALRSMEGSLVQLVDEPAEDGGTTAYWTFRHPTISDALSQRVSDDPDLLHIFLVGMPLRDLLAETTGGDVGLRGTLIVPEAHWPLILNRIQTEPAPEADRAAFLAARCSDQFLRTAAQVAPRLLTDLVRRPPAGVRLAARLSALAIMDDELRLAYVDRLTELAVDGEPSYLTGAASEQLFLEEELKLAHLRVREELLPVLDQIVDSLEDNWDGDTDPDSYLQQMTDELDALEESHGDEGDAQELIEAARDRLEEVRSSLEESMHPEPDWDDMPYERSAPIEPQLTAEIFDDIDE
jgi:hypothetical protein